jgi:hypothetical protein
LYVGILCDCCYYLKGSTRHRCGGRCPLVTVVDDPPAVAVNGKLAGHRELADQANVADHSVPHLNVHTSSRLWPHVTSYLVQQIERPDDLFVSTAVFTLIAFVVEEIFAIDNYDPADDGPEAYFEG